MSAYALAVHLRVPRTRIERLVREETPVPPDTALRLPVIGGPRQISGSASRPSSISRRRRTA